MLATLGDEAFNAILLIRKKHLQEERKTKFLGGCYVCVCVFERRMRCFIIILMATCHGIDVFSMYMYEFG